MGSARGASRKKAEERKRKLTKSKNSPTRSVNEDGSTNRPRRLTDELISKARYGEITPEETPHEGGQHLALSMTCHPEHLYATVPASCERRREK